MASTVAIAHTRVGRTFQKIHSMNPANTGALPIVTTVPTATPVKRTDVKNRLWNRAIAIAAKMVHFHDQLRNEIFRIAKTASSKTPPPIPDLTHATANEEIPSVKKVCVVPTVPQSIAASSTNRYGKIFTSHTPFNYINYAIIRFKSIRDEVLLKSIYNKIN